MARHLLVDRCHSKPKGFQLLEKTFIMHYSQSYLACPFPHFQLPGALCFHSLECHAVVTRPWGEVLSMPNSRVCQQWGTVLVSCSGNLQTCILSPCNHQDLVTYWEGRFLMENIRLDSSVHLKSKAAFYYKMNVFVVYDIMLHKDIFT